MGDQKNKEKAYVTATNMTLLWRESEKGYHVTRGGELRLGRK